MKKQILTLIIGILIGAIITTAVFLILKGNTSNQGSKFSRDGMPSMDGSFVGGESNFSRPNEGSSQNENNNENNINE